MVKASKRWETSHLNEKWRIWADSQSLWCFLLFRLQTTKQIWVEHIKTSDFNGFLRLLMFFLSRPVLAEPGSCVDKWLFGDVKVLHVTLLVLLMSVLIWGVLWSTKTWIVKKLEKKMLTFKDLPMNLGQCYFSIIYILLFIYITIMAFIKIFN